MKKALAKASAFWYKFKNSIVIDGTGYDVTFSIRDKGNEQYQYLIKFEKNATPEVSNTVNTYSKDLLRRYPVSQTENTTPSTESQDQSANEPKKFSMSDRVEETKDLVAVHNLTPDELLKSLQLGGLPMPSIAIIKARSGHIEYGTVSLLFGKDTIDPQLMKANKVYGGDAWTPTYPRIEYKVNQAVQSKISKKYYALAEKFGYDAVRPLYNYVNDAERLLDNAKGEKALKDDLY